MPGNQSPFYGTANFRTGDNVLALKQIPVEDGQLWLESRMESVTSQRKQLYRKLRTVAVKSDEAASVEISIAITALSKELCQLRQEVKLCRDIAMRSGVLPERIQEARKTQRKEQNEHDQFRRCSRTNR